MNIFKIACIFIGTVVGAGLASGKEIYQFFSIYGIKSFLGFIICFLLYIIVGNIICNICNKKGLSSYNLLINEVCPKVPAIILNIFTSLYYLFSSSIIFAASGSIISQFFSVSRIYGILLMIGVTILILKFSMKGLAIINSISVPIMVSVIFIMFLLFEFFSDPMSINTSMVIADVEREIRLHNNIILSSFLYGGFNILSATGILAPLSYKNTKGNFKKGLFIGTLLLVLISMVINYLILTNMPYIARYDIPLLYISKIFGRFFQILILVLIWVEMLSTETSSLYSLAKGISNKYGISLFKGVLILLIISVPISVLGFSKLISVIYPFFGFLSFIFIYYIIKYQIDNKKEL